MTRPFPGKRRYKTVRVAAQEGGFAVLLDEAPMRTPGAALLAAPTEALGAAIAGEWAAVADRVELRWMALTRLSIAVIDQDADGPAAWASDILHFAGSDLLCYRANEPAALARRQNDLWTPYLDWADAALGARLATTSGLAAIEQPSEALDAVAARLAALDAWRLFGTRRATEIAGSAVLALALEAGAFPLADILAAARLDENFQAGLWGWDGEAAAREARIEGDFAAVARFLDLLKDQAPWRVSGP